MMKMIKITTVVLSAALLSGCATIVTGSSQDISVASTPPGADCSVLQGELVVATLRTPATVRVKKTRDDLMVKCVEATAGEAEQVNESGVEPWVFGNILIGGIIGLVIDWASGGYNDYEDTMDIAIPASTSELPTKPVADPSQAGAKTS